MFRVDNRNRMPYPTALFGESEDVNYFEFIEVTMNMPTFLVRVMPKASEDDPRMFRQFFAESAGMAVKLLLAEAWVRSELYVILPYYISKSPLAMQKCLRVEAIRLLDSDEPGWRLMTSTGTYVYSFGDGAPEYEGESQLLWSFKEQ